MTNQQLVQTWILAGGANAASVVLEIAALLTVGQKAALRTRIIEDIKIANAKARADFDDDVADTLEI
jgi:hypothetical protein